MQQFVSFSVELQDPDQVGAEVAERLAEHTQKFSDNGLKLADWQVIPVQGGEVAAVIARFIERC